MLDKVRSCIVDTSRGFPPVADFGLYVRLQAEGTNNWQSAFDDFWRSVESDWKEKLNRMLDDVLVGYGRSKHLAGTKPAVLASSHDMFVKGKADLDAFLKMTLSGTPCISDTAEFDRKWKTAEDEIHAGLADSFEGEGDAAPGQKDTEEVDVGEASRTYRSEIRALAVSSPPRL